MKRCPQCEFIYEDDERRCDLDGTELVHDPRPLPDSSSPKVRAAERRASRTFTIIAGSGVVLGLSLLFLFDTITSSNSPGNNQPSSTINAPQSAPTVAPRPSATATPSPNSPVSETPASDDRQDRSSARVAKLSAPPSRGPAGARADGRSPDNSADPKAKVASVIKKTGQILSRPFKH